MARPEGSALPPASASGKSDRWPEMLRALRHRNFQLFFGGQLISLVGTWMDTAAEALLVYRLTGSSLLLGTVAFAGQIPVFLLGPLGGAVADRRDRRRVVIATQTAFMILAAILAALTLSRRIAVWEVIAIASAMGVVNAFDVPARQAFLAEMVTRDDLMNAIALNSSMFNGARVIGPVIAGIVVYKVGEGWCFFANSVSYIAVIAGLLMMRVAPIIRERRVSPLEHIAEGFRFARDTAPIRNVLLLVGLAVLVAVPGYSVLMPVFAEHILHGTARTYGILMGAVGVGALTAALTLAMRRGIRGLGRWIAVACAGFGVGVILFAFSRWYFVSLVILVPVGFFMMLQMTSSNTLIQAMVPDRLRGRIMAVYSVVSIGLAPFGSLLAGALADRIGAPWTLASGGVIAIAGAAVFARELPKVRVEARQLIAAQGMMSGDPREDVAAPAPIAGAASPASEN